ncbi:excalibur calcium-binding domain-containing protein [Microvirga terricola]|nr:excalibur calcium-binding domain-containing protein [Microvirga terricola]
MKGKAKGWSVHTGRDPGQEAQKLKRRFQAVSEASFKKRNFRKKRWSSNSAMILAALFAIAAYLLYAWVWNSNLWPSNQALLQARYIPDCASARLIGVTPLYKGFAGYRESLDRDRDGIACEPYPF